jgi:hypothetical protein
MKQMLRLSENPTMLPPNVESLTDLKGTWWLAYTKPRFEKAFAWDMLSRGIGYFLPMREKKIFSGGRKRHVMLPIFASYVFFCGLDRDRYTAMTTNRLCYTVEVVDQNHLIGELVKIEKALSSKAIVDTYPRLPIGSRCKVISGPMMNTEGVIIERNCAKARMVIEVTILSQGVVLEIDADLLEPIE